MSGRAYARNAQGFLGGGTDLESVMPHTFRIAAPKRVSNARELAIRRCVRFPFCIGRVCWHEQEKKFSLPRVHGSNILLCVCVLFVWRRCRAIRRRCMEKNWKKLISRRHVRLESAVKDTQTEPLQVGAQSDATASAAAGTTGTDDKEKAVANGTTKSPEKKEGGEKSASAPATSVGEAKATENGARKPKQEKKPDSETVGLAKRQLLVSCLRLLPSSLSNVSRRKLTLDLCINVHVGTGGEIAVARGAEARKISPAEGHSRGGSAVQE